MADLDQMVLDGMLIDTELAKKGVHFVVLPARYKQLLVDVGSWTGRQSTATSARYCRLQSLASFRSSRRCPRRRELSRLRT